MKNQILTPILLPTEDASHLFFLLKDKLEFQEHPLKDLNYGNHHLHLFSELPIKEGNWYINLLDNKIWKAEKGHVNTDGLIGSRLKKIEFTTDPKLWDIRMIDVISGKTENTGVPVIDGNTKAIKPLKHWYSKTETQVNFLEEYCRCYNQKDNQKGVDVGKLRELMCVYQVYNKDGELKPFLETELGKDMFSEVKALQSNAGGFSLNDMEKSFRAGQKREETDWKNSESEHQQPYSPTFPEFIQSLTKEQPKGDIIIECEMEEVPFSDVQVGGYKNNNLTAARSYQRIKLKDGQPIIHFR